MFATWRGDLCGVCANGVTKAADRDEMGVLQGLGGTRNVRRFLAGKLNEACSSSTNVDMRDAAIRLRVVSSGGLWYQRCPTSGSATRV
jgi:hypothetical protein